MNIKLAKTDDAVMGCYDVMSQLRPEVKKEDFLAKVKRQAKNGYRLAYIDDGGKVAAVAGFRFSETLAWDKLLYVDDLITDKDKRSKGYGDKLIDYLVELAKDTGCKTFHLDSGVWRYAAHRFYFRKRLTISCYHFELEL